MTNINDIVIVGGGPAGLITALNAKKSHINVTVLESRNQIGQIEHCAGLLSIEGLKRLELSNLPEDIVQNKKIIGAKLYSPSGKELIVKKETPHAYVVDRAKFNKYLAQLAKEKGVEIKTSFNVKEIHQENNYMKLVSGKKKARSNIKAKIVILAEGRFPNLNEKIGLRKPESIIYASQFIMKNVKNLESEYVELYQIPKHAPGFFAWVIPIDKDTAKVGVGTRYKPANRYLKAFLNDEIIKNRFISSRIIKKMSGAIPLGSYIKKTYMDNVLVVGDAAGQTKPTTGGGVILGGIAAQIAGKVAMKAIEKQEYGKNFLSTYEKKWKKEIKTNLQVMKLVRKYLDSLSEKDLEILFEKLNQPNFKRIFTKKGDVDNQKRLVLKLITKPSMWIYILRTGLKYLFKKKKWK